MFKTIRHVSWSILKKNNKKLLSELVRSHAIPTIAAELVSQLVRRLWTRKESHPVNIHWTAWRFWASDGRDTSTASNVYITHHVYITVAVPSSHYLMLLSICLDDLFRWLTPVSRSNILLCVVHRGVLQGRSGGVIVRDSLRLRPLLMVVDLEWRRKPGAPAQSLDRALVSYYD